MDSKVISIDIPEMKTTIVKSLLNVWTIYSYSSPFKDNTVYILNIHCKSCFRDSKVSYLLYNFFKILCQQKSIKNKH